MTPLTPDLAKLLMETSWGVLKDCGLHKTPVEGMTREQIDMVAERIGFELKAKLTEFFGGRNPEWLKEQFEVVDESVEQLRVHFQDRREAYEGED